jgi:succinate dehydrogenase/fumarate reductase flavoprotein subunit
MAGYTHFSNSRLSGGVFHVPHPDGDRAAMLEYVKAMMSGENIPWKLEGEQPHVSDEMAKMYVQEIYGLREWLLAQDPDLDPAAMAPAGEASFPTFPKFKEAKYGSTRNIRHKGPVSADRFVPGPKAGKTSGESLMWALLEEGIRKKRPGIDLHFNTPAKRLVQNTATKEIYGVIALKDGKEIAVKAKKAVVLCAGGLEYNLAMRRAFLEGAGVKGYGFYGSPDNRGEGIWMAMQVGAALAKPAKCASRVEPAVKAGRAWDETGMRQGLSNTFRGPGNIIVDNMGKRVMDEFLAVDSTRPYRYQSYKEFVKYDLLRMDYTRQPSWQVCDEKVRAEGRLVGGVCVGSENPRLNIPWKVDNSDAIAKGWVYKGDTIEELAAKIKADPENRNLMDAKTLVETVKNWNSYCATGKDLEFDRLATSMGPIEKPPFYALPLYPGGSNTKGSIDADATRHVLDWDYKPIPRFYTAGEMSSVFKFTYQAGGNITECMICGRVAGRNAVAEKPWDS